MNLYKMPITDLGFDDDISIDMSDLSHDIFSTNNKYKSSLIYIRNCGINAYCDFSNCNYSDISMYLIEYITSGINFICDDIASTWIYVMCKYNGMTTYIPSLLSEDDADTFISTNLCLISSLQSVINSLPTISLYLSEFPGDRESLYEIEQCDDETISLININQITKYNEFIHLINDGAKYYPYMFNDMNKSNILFINGALPYSNMLYLMRASEDTQNRFVEEFNEFIKIDEGDDTIG